MRTCTSLWVATAAEGRRLARPDNVELDRHGRDGKSCRRTVTVNDPTGRRAEVEEPAAGPPQKADGRLTSAANPAGAEVRTYGLAGLRGSDVMPETQVTNDWPLDDDPSQPPEPAAPHLQ